MKPQFHFSLALVLIVSAIGCGDHPSPGAADSTAKTAQPGHTHEHVAPHGGQVVILGDEAFHLEFVLDREAGRLTAYVLDGHMENFVRLPAPTLELSCTSDGLTKELTLAAVASQATGETVGDTSQFVGEEDWLKSSSALSGLIKSIDIRGVAFINKPFSLPAAVPMIPAN